MGTWRHMVVPMYFCVDGSVCVLLFRFDGSTEQWSFLLCIYEYETCLKSMSEDEGCIMSLSSLAMYTQAVGLRGGGV